MLKNLPKLGHLTEHWRRPLFIFDPTPGDLAWTLGIALLSVLGLGTVAKVVNYRKTLQQMLIGIGMATIGFLLARLHLHVFDRIFLWQGRLVRASRPVKGVQSRKNDLPMADN